jgi:hypothetical protein
VVEHAFAAIPSEDYSLSAASQVYKFSASMLTFPFSKWCNSYIQHQSSSDIARYLMFIPAFLSVQLFELQDFRYFV